MNGRCATLVAMLLTAGFMDASCNDVGNYKFNTVTFAIAGPLKAADGPVPNITIDTNVKVTGIRGGTIETSKPYSIGFDYTDETFTFAAAEITKLTATNADGVNDPGAAALKLPFRILARPYEVTNSAGDIGIVKTKVQLVSGKIPGVITRDVPFTLRLEGKLIKSDGTEIPFAQEAKYDVVTDKSTKPLRYK